MALRALIWPVGTLLSMGAMMAAFVLGFRDSALGCFGFAVLSLLILTLRDVTEASQSQSARQKALQEAARRLALSFRPTAPFNVLGWPESFRLTRDAIQTQQAIQRARSLKWVSALQPTSTNVMEGAERDATIAVFDHECDRSRHNDTTTRQTVFAVRSPRLSSPHFALMPASWWRRILRRFTESPALEHGYCVITENEQSLGPIDERLFSLLDGKTCLEAGEGFLLLYCRNRLVAPQDIDEFLASGRQIYAVLVSDAKGG
jgi:hypothetical protein